MSSSRSNDPVTVQPPAVVWIDGERAAPGKAVVSVFDRGFLYGDSVFETIRTYDGVPFALEEHTQRLAWSAARVHIDLPVSPEKLAEEVRAAVIEAGYPETYIRLMLTRGVGAMGLDPGTTEHPLRVLILAPLVAPAESAYREGVKVVTFATQRVGDATGAAGAKVGNYLVAVLAMKRAREAGATEALIVDHEGKVVEGSTSNVFAVREGKVITPSEAEGILPGITRARILRAAERMGLPVEFRALSKEELAQADEVFISSSIRELLPVVDIDGEKVGSGAPGPVTQQLHAAFRQLVREG